MFTPRPQRLAAAYYQSLVGRSTVIERDRYGEKVLQTPEGLMVKIFRRKRFWSSALVFPYALRFVHNTRQLAERGISTVTVVDYSYCPALHKHLVTYRPLIGTTLRKALADNSAGCSPLLAEFGRFVALQHAKGVYFRSLHFGNVIVPSEGGELGLIDVADTSFYRRALSIRLRARNFRHMLRYREDVGFLSAYGGGKFLADYLAAADLSARDRECLVALLDELPLNFTTCP